MNESIEADVLITIPHLIYAIFTIEKNLILFGKSSTFIQNQENC